MVRDALSIYAVDEALLQQLEPDVIVTQSQCEVCAVSLRDVEQAVCEWIESRPKIVSLVPNALDDVWRDIATVAAALGAADRGESLVAMLRARIAAIAARARRSPERPTVAVVEWIDPLMAAGNWMPELIDLAGGVSLFGAVGEHSPWMSLDELAERDPDWILVIPCGFDLVRTRAEIASLASRPEWRRLRAVRVLTPPEKTWLIGCMCRAGRKPPGQLRAGKPRILRTLQF
jgi:iron complex transport system substrate-binding protein